MGSQERSCAGIQEGGRILKGIEVNTDVFFHFFITKLTLEPWEWRGPKVTRDERPHATHLTHPSHASHHLWWNWNWPWRRHRTTTSSSSSSLTSGSIFPVVTSPSLPRERWSCLLSLVQFRQAFLLAELVGHLLLLKPHLCHHCLGLLNSRVFAICFLLNQLVSIGPFHVPVQVASSAAAPSATTTLIKPTTTSLMLISQERYGRNGG